MAEQTVENDYIDERERRRYFASAGMRYRPPSREPKVYIDTADWWIGYYRGPNHHYVCPLPTVVIRWRRRVVLPPEQEKS